MSFDPQHVCYGCFREKEPGTVCSFCGFSENSERAYLAVPIGTILDGRYLIGKVLGVGGFGITYLGYDLTLDYKVAVKEYMPSGFATRAEDKYTLTVTSSSQQQAYDEGLDKFLSEARTLAKFHNTPNIVSVQDFFKENNTAYFVMEYVDGESLKDYLDKNGGRISYADASKILIPIMKALSKVHEQGLIHRDISPDNISITSTGEPKLLDFGAARSAYAENKSVSVILKHGLAPIEQYSNHGNMGPWTDVYAMGASLYRCITGVLPPESIERIHADTIRTPSSMGIAIPAYAETALMKSLAVNPESRFSNIEQFIASLNGASISAASPAGARMQTPVQPAAPVAAPAAARPMTGTVQAPVYTQVQPVVPQAGYPNAQSVTSYSRNYTAAQSVTPPAVSSAPVGQKKKSVNKGALTGIIIGGVALVMIVIGTITAINITNNSSKPRHTIETSDDESNGGHFGSKPTTESTTEESSESYSGIGSESSDASMSGGATSREGGTVTDLGSLKASIWIPDGYVKNENGFYTKTNGGFSVKFAEMVKDTPVYDISDVENNKKFFIDYYLGATVNETYAGKYTLPTGKVCYEIDGESGGTKFILLAVPCYTPSSKPGCYFISSWYRSNEERSNIITAIKSFVSTGDVASRLDDFWADVDSNPNDTKSTDVRLKMLFEPKYKSGFGKQGDTVIVFSNKNVTNKTMVMNVSVTSVKNQTQVRNESKEKFVTDFKNNNKVSLKETKTSTVVYNNIIWNVDTHDFGNYTAYTISSVYDNGMVVCINAKCTNTAKISMNNYIKDLERSIRLVSLT
ncbi:MAG: serine/threonine protein kinase [Clostridiales bacterium]|nr:serine/threonine protein kinase [Clostridiales bacterium]